MHKEEAIKVLLEHGVDVDSLEENPVFEAIYALGFNEGETVQRQRVASMIVDCLAN